ncbi:SICA-like antigen [Plasmodium coatneyi]|uniref:SICA-like antigen n=1 Tax=Plasmodium coatneyi TaxID=208452 RepID=A0A1B1DWV5_9APIC|nr:SICA-like antigen [Plasmodium coatneyi]ANQ07276.1 SICA-like antigen [Plasmodium coatneyi]
MTGVSLLSELIRKWVEKGRHVQQGIVDDGIWDEMKTIFNNLMGTIAKGEEGMIAEMCATGMNREGENIETWTNKEKELCKAMLKVMLYTNGLTHNFQIRKGVESEDDVTTYFRCLIGTITLVDLYREHCLFDKVIQHVSNMVGGWVGNVQRKGRPDAVCKGIDLKITKMGGQLIGKTIKEWVEGRKKEVGKYDLIMRDARNCDGSEAGRGTRKEQGDGDSTGGEEIERSVEEIKQLIENENFVSQSGADDIVKSMNPHEDEEEMKKKLGKGIDDKVKEEKDAPTQTTRKAEEEGQDDAEEEIEEEEEEEEAGKVQEENGNEDKEDPQEPKHTEEAAGGGGGALGAGGDTPSTSTPSPAKLINMKDNPVLPYLPLAPAMMGISIMTYLLWKYFGMLGKGRKRYRRAYQVRGPTLQEQIIQHVEDDGPREYILVKERKPRSMPIKRRKKRGIDRRAGRGGGVRRRMIIDIHLEVLDECQKVDLHLKKEDFFEILVQEFMGSEFIKEENVPKEKVPSSNSGFREEDFLPRKEFTKEEVPRVDVPKEQVPSSDSLFKEEKLCS